MNETNPNKTLTVRVDSPEAAFDRLEERFAALDRGEDPEALFESVLQREEDIARLINPNTMRLLRTIARNDPGSIREAARLVDRDVHQVHTELQDLERMNLVKFETEGQSRRPYVWYDEIDVRFPIEDDGTDDRPKAST